MLITNDHSRMKITFGIFSVLSNDIGSTPQLKCESWAALTIELFSGYQMCFVTHRNLCLQMFIGNIV